jgi:hypothetical protein
VTIAIFAGKAFLENVDAKAVLGKTSAQGAQAIMKVGPLPTNRSKKGGRGS